MSPSLSALSLSLMLFAAPAFAGPGPHKLERVAERLGLDEASAKRMQEAAAPYKQELEQLRERARAQTDILRRAADGEAAALSQVDGAIRELKDVRSKMSDTRGKLFAEVSRGLGPQQKAKLALTLQRGGKMHRHGHR